MPIRTAHRATDPTVGRSFGPLKTRHGRLLFLDLARGLAVVFMVCQHVQLMFAVDGGEGSTVGGLFLLLGTAPAAPVFMVAMGFLFGCGSHPARRVMLRGLGLIALGYGLNVARFTIPLLLAEGSVSPAEAEEVTTQLGTPLDALLTVDILQLAGLSLLIMAALRPLLRDARVTVVLALGVFAVSPLLWTLGGGPLTGLLWGEGVTVAFPLFPWLGYPLLGLAFAQIARRADAERRLMTRAAAVSLFAAAVGGMLMLLAPAWGVVFAPGDYLRSGLPVQLVVAGFVFLWLTALWWLAAHVTGRAAFRYLTSLSRHVTAVYVVQWVIIGWLALVVGVSALDPAVAALTVVPIVVVSHLVAIGWSRARRSLAGRLWDAGPAGG